MINLLRKLFRIRSPQLESLGYYACENCRRHDDCDCDICDDGETVMCNRHKKHVNRYHTCRHFKRIVIKPLGKKYRRGIRRELPIIDEWCDYPMTHKD